MADESVHGELREVLASLRAQLERQRDCGAHWLRAALPPSGAGAMSVPAAPPAPPRAAPVAPRAAAAAAPRGDLFSEPGVQQAGTLEALRGHIGECQRCKLAKLGRSTIVFGVGNPSADLMFVGEGPGFDEDRLGEPFVGRAGQLLTEIISKGMKLQRSDVYIANIVKCRPPENRAPEPDEMARCIPFLHRQIELVRPRVLVALGAIAAQALLSVKTPISRLRGVWQDYRGIKVMPTFHPAYLLRNPADKRLVWADIKLVMAELGLTG
jgi:DNA polymerase